MSKRYIFSPFLTLLIITSILLQACTDYDLKKRQTTHTEYFDTVTVFTAYTDSESFSKMSDIVSETLSLYHKLLDRYNTYDKIANVKTINDNAPEKVTVCKELFEFLEWSKNAYTLTAGQTNILFGSVTSLWHNARKSASSGESVKLPSNEELKKANEHTSIELLKLDEESLTVSIDSKDASIDTGALAKGYVADKLYLSLIDAGYTNFIINLGGNIKTHGAKKNGDPWTVGIEDPSDTSKNLCSLPLSDASLVTSGSYQRYFELEGVRYHHIIDPETLMPQNLFLSVSVKCESSALADVLSTALFNMSLEEGMALVGSLDAVDVLWVLADENNTVRYTAGFSDYFEE